jgi:hypothetical protein
VVVVLAAFSSAALHFYGFGYKEFFISVRLGSQGGAVLNCEGSSIAAQQVAQAPDSTSLRVSSLLFIAT